MGSLFCLLVLSSGAVFVPGCSTERDPVDFLGAPQAGIVVVDVVMMVGEDLPLVRLRRTLDPAKAMSVFEDGVQGAQVEIRKGSETAHYVEVSADPGLYVLARSISDFDTVEPETEYELWVETEEGEIVTARTLTPPVLTVDRWVLLENDGETVDHELATFEEAGPGIYDQPENQIVHGDGFLEGQFERPDVPAFQVAVHSLDPQSEFVIDVSFLDEDQLDEFKRDASSPVLVLDDGRARLPWFAIPWEGPYLIDLFAVDRNWYDLVRSFPALNQGGPGFGGPTGDSFERPLFRIEGGIGLFGSGSKASIGFRIHPPE